MKAFTGNWNSGAFDLAPGISVPSFFTRTGQRICRLAALLEAATLLPFATLLAAPMFLYLLLNHGFYEILFGSKRNFPAD